MSRYSNDIDDALRSMLVRPLHQRTTMRRAALFSVMLRVVAATALVLMLLTPTTATVVMEGGRINNLGANWTTVNFSNTYTSAVMSTTISYSYSMSTQQTCVRLRNVGTTSFEVRVQLIERATDGSFDSPVTADVFWIAAEEGSYNEDGIQMDAIKVTSTKTARKSAFSNANTDTVTFGQTFVSAPIIVGSVMTYNDQQWSVFFAQDDTTTTTAHVSKHVAEDTVSTRANEVLGVIAIAPGCGGSGNLAFTAGITATNAKGVENDDGPYEQNVAISDPATVTMAIQGMNGGDGAQAVIASSWQPGQPISYFSDEDSIQDADRTHLAEALGYLFLQTLGSDPW